MTVLQFAVLGLGIGAVYALIGASVVTIYRGSGVVNFASAGIGAFGTFVGYHLYLDSGWPVGTAIVVALAVSAALGGLYYMGVMRFLARAPLATQIVATLGLMLALTGVINLLFAPTGNAVAVPPILPSGSTHILGANVQYQSILIVPVAMAVVGGLILLQRKTRFGLATSAVAEDQTVAGSMGLSVNLIAGMNWAIGGGVAAVAVLLAAPIYALEAQSLVLLIIPALAAALVKGFDSLPVTLVAGLGLGIIQSEISRYTTNPGWPTAVPMALIIVTLALRGSIIPTKSDRSPRVPSVTSGKLHWRSVVWVVAGIALVETVPLTWVSSLTTSLLLGLVVLSVVVITGYAGQLSVVQLSLAGVAGLFTAYLSTHAGMPLWLATVLAPIGAAIVGAGVALPALRTRGASLAIASLAFAELIDSLVLSNPSVAGALTKPMPPLELFGVHLDPVNHPRSFAFICLIALIVGIVVVANIRRGVSGRRVLAARANERAAMALGISVPGVKIFTFGFSALLAGLAGALLEAQLRYVDFSAFTVVGSIEATLNGVLGGAGWPSGSLIGGAISGGGITGQAIGKVVTPGNWLLVISGIGAIAVVLQSGDGLVPLWIRQGRYLYRTVFGWLHRTVVSTEKAPGSTSDAKPVVPLSARPDVPRNAVLVEALDITVRFGGQLALDHLNVRVEPGSVTGLIGPNGAGKSTLIDVVCGFVNPEKGSVRVDGVSIDGWSPHKRARAGIGRSFQALELFEDMSILENLKVASDPCRFQNYFRDAVYPAAPTLSAAGQGAIDVFHLGNVLDKRPTEVDYATRRLVAIARAAAGNPGVLLLDEPAAGLDKTARLLLGELLRELAHRWGIAVLLVEHDLDLVFAVCDWVQLIDCGASVCIGTPEEMRNNPILMSTYLGAETPVEELQPADTRPPTHSARGAR